MRNFLIAAFMTFAIAAYAAEPVPPPLPPAQPDAVTTLENQLSEIGCNAERIAAAQEIAKLRQQVASMTAENQKQAKK